MITRHKCEKIHETPWKDKIKECCDKEDPENPRGCDCCYDTWTKELKEVNTRYSEADEEAKHVSAHLSFTMERRDRLKTWYDELTKANDLSRQICDQLEVMLHQVDRVSVNTKHAVKAIKVLYCMVRDFYMQIDLIKTKYDQIYNCIRCLNDPALVPGQGILKCLEDYGKKLDAMITTRDELIKMVITAIYTAYRINKNIAKEYGLYMVIIEWMNTFHCDESCGDTGEATSEYAAQRKGDIQENYGNEHEHEDEHEHEHGHGHEAKHCQLDPMLQFPICNDPYYEEIKEKYEHDNTKANELAKTLIDLNKKKESLLACKQSLEAAIVEVDPKMRCK